MNDEKIQHAELNCFLRILFTNSKVEVMSSVKWLAVAHDEVFIHVSINSNVGQASQHQKNFRPEGENTKLQIEH